MPITLAASLSCKHIMDPTANNIKEKITAALLLILPDGMGRYGRLIKSDFKSIASFNALEAPVKHMTTIHVIATT